MNHKLDTDIRICFYENEFYPLSNFSAFRVRYRGVSGTEVDYDTSEACYHAQKFPCRESDNLRHWEIRNKIWRARSAHETLKIAEEHKTDVRADWLDIRVPIMRDILRAKAAQHEYVRRKLLETGDRELCEDSWRDAWWGTGPDGNGENMLGRLWMELRAELREKATQ